MNFDFKSKIVVTDKGIIKAVFLSQMDPQLGDAAYLVDISFTGKEGDSYDGNTVTPDPDKVKKAALEAEKQKALLALQSADDKAAILKALSDAEAAVTPLAEITK